MTSTPGPRIGSRGLAAGREIFFFQNNANDVANRILEALKHSVTGADAVKLKVSVGSRFLRDALGAALGRPDLNLGTGKDDVTLQVEARRGRGGSQVALTMRGGPLVLETPGETEVDLGNETAVRKARLEVTALSAEGNFESAEVRANLEGSLSVDRVKWRGETYEQASGRLALSFLSKPGRRELATGTIQDAKFIGRLPLLDVQAKVRVQGKLPVRIDRDLNVDTDLTIFKEKRPG